MNYTNVCHYCGRIYQSNRSTSKYCCSEHNSLYSRYGSQIKAVLSEEDRTVDYDQILHDIYSEMEIFYDDGWGVAYSLRAILEDFMYKGPLPKGDEILVVGSYVIATLVGQAIARGNIYFAKPIGQITAQEKRSKLFISGGYTADQNAS